MRPVRFSLCASVCVLGWASQAAALSYALSDAGLEPPGWESGRAEMVIADIDGDGHPDLLSLGDHGNPHVNTSESGIMVWRGDGAGGWVFAQTGTLGYGGIAVGDADGDGLADVAIAMHHNGGSGDLGDQLIEVARGDGTGTAWTPWDDGLASDGETYGMFGIVFVDSDGDGRLDVVANSFGCCNGLHAYRNNGDGTWTPVWHTTTGSPNSTEDLATGDVNGDGFLDLAAGSSAGTVWLSDGAGHFTRADGNLPTFTTGAHGPSLGDVNGDGHADLSWATSSGGAQVWTWADSAHWTNASAGLPANGPFEATRLADMDGDGDLDLVAFGNGTLAVFLGNGAGAWTNGARNTLPSPGYYSALAAPVDVDHNGRPDIALVSQSGSGFSPVNHPHVLRETSVATTLAITPLSPRPAESWRVGVVRDIEWCAAVPAGSGASSVDLDYSTTGSGGPWLPLASGVPNSGRAQWTLPITAPSDSCYVRYTLHAGASVASAITPGAFRSVGGPAGVGTPEAHAALSLQLARAGSGWRASCAQRARWSVRDVAGRTVRSLGLARAIVWDGTTAAGARCAAGVYLLRVDTDAGSGAARVLVVR